MEPILGLDSGVANTIITAITTLLSAFIGGVIGSVATRRATERGLAHSLSMAEANRRATLRGVLLGIRTELELLFEIYQEEMKDELSSFEEGKAVYFTLPIYQDIFTVYESNCSSIGQIEEDALRRAIIRTYLLAKSLVNAHTYNNRLIEKYEKLTREDTGGLAAKEAFNQMKDYGAQIIGTYEEAKKSLTECFELIDSSELSRGESSAHVRFAAG
jgi:hypothetical protein